MKDIHLAPCSLNIEARRLRQISKKPGPFVPKEYREISGPSSLLLPASDEDVQDLMCEYKVVQPKETLSPLSIDEKEHRLVVHWKTLNRIS